MNLRPISAPGRLVAMLSVLAAALLLAACGDDDGSAAPPETNDAVHDQHDEDQLEEPGMVHVHGLGINPADDTLYVATHTGLFRLPGSGEPERVSERLHDFMGFTVVGPDHFLTSGHPDFRDYREGILPPHLGLMESDDGGRTWAPVALLGEADFHALRFQHGTLYGYDSTSQGFMVLPETGAWERRSTLSLLDFVVHPERPDDIVATTDRGLVRSNDGGRSWNPVDGAPLLVWLEWDHEGDIWGIDPEGRVFQANGDGQTWEQTGTAPGQPEALLRANGALYVALHAVGIALSEDDGQTWTTLYEPS